VKLAPWSYRGDARSRSMNKQEKNEKFEGIMVKIGRMR
jgi:hypothetical protein